MEVPGSIRDTRASNPLVREEKKEKEKRETGRRGRERKKGKRKEGLGSIRCFLSVQRTIKLTDYNRFYYK